LNWSAIPDLAAVALLICAFASVARHTQQPVSGLWLTGWLMILTHFSSGMFIQNTGVIGQFATVIFSASLVWAGHLYMHASIPYRKDRSSRWMLTLLLASNTLYVAILSLDPGNRWALNLSAVIMGLCPIGILLSSIRRVNHPLRWVIAFLYGSLTVFLLIYQNRPGGIDLAWNALMFTVYLGCSIFVCCAYRRATAGAFVTIAGFFSWASVFVAAPMLAAFLPQAHIEHEVWNLPKFVVAVGMMLLLLEDQIEHNKHPALHDELTGLPNRRLFLDRINNALERSRRTGTQMALLVVDLDGFKQVNDSMGHHVGDLLLQRVAMLFSERVRRSDTVSRTGGDEFSLILEEPTNRKEAEQVEESLRMLLNDPLDLVDQRVRIGASIGIAIFPEDATDAESLCIAADLRMYDAKHSARMLRQETASAQQKFLSERPSDTDRELGLA